MIGQPMKSNSAAQATQSRGRPSICPRERLEPTATLPRAGRLTVACTRERSAGTGDGAPGRDGVRGRTRAAPGRARRWAPCWPRARSAWVAAYLVAGDKVPRGTTVAGVAIGGLSEDEAAQRLEEELGGRADRALEVTVDDRTAEVSPEEAGMSVDYAASAAEAGARKSWSPAWLWRYATGGDEVDPWSTSTRTCSGYLSGLGDEVRTEPGRGRDPVQAQGHPGHRPGRRHRARHRRRARALVAAYLDEDDAPPSCRWSRRRRTSTRTTSSSARTEFAEPAMSGR